MEYQETGRFGRITKNLRKHGFEKEMEIILHDSHNFSHLKKEEQTVFVENVVNRMVETIGIKNTKNVLFDCGAQCCGKSWTTFTKNIWDKSNSIEEFFVNLNLDEEKFNTNFTYHKNEKSITVERSKCICGMINTGQHFKKYSPYCSCSNGHMSAFFNTVFKVKKINLESSIYNGAEKCKWIVELEK